jgi:hypothetical protein
MKPKPNQYFRMRLFHKDKCIETVYAQTVKKMAEIAGCPIGRVYKTHGKGRKNLKCCSLQFEIDQVIVIENIVSDGKTVTMNREDGSELVLSDSV